MNSLIMLDRMILYRKKTDTLNRTMSADTLYSILKVE